jgi:hypothetical protein
MSKLRDRWYLILAVLVGPLAGIMAVAVAHADDVWGP